MPRIGEVLIASGLLDAARLAEALRAQVMWGGRIGTALVELGHVRLDALAVALGRQHGLPAALGAHFDRADDSLRLPAPLADRLGCAPLVRAGKRVVIAAISPLDAVAQGVVADALAIAVDQLIVAIAPEVRIRYFLEHVYGIARPPRLLRAPGGPSRMFAEMAAVDEPAPPDGRMQAPVVDGVLLAPEVELPASIAVAIASAPERADLKRRHYVETLADLAAAHRDRAVEQLARAPRLPTEPIALADDRELAAALHELEHARDRDTVARLAIAALARFEPAVTGALLLTIRGAAAASWTGFRRDGNAPPALAVPLDDQGLVPGVLRRRATRRGASGDLGTVDYLLLAALGAAHGDLAIVPIAIAEQVVGLIAVATATGEPISQVEAVAGAAGTAFARLMREAKRGVGRPENVLARVDLARGRSSPP